MKPTYEELENELRIVTAELSTTKADLSTTKADLSTTKADLSRTKAELVEAVTRQQTIEGVLKQALERIKSLEERLGKNSNNSSKPPSTDQKANTSGPSNHKKRPSRRGAHRALIPVSDVDHIVITTLENCPHCGSDNLSAVTGGLILQQVEIPEVRGLTTQYECTKHRCHCCGTHSFANLPEGIPNSAFGPRLMGFFGWCTGNLCISKRDAIALIKGVYQIDLSAGSAINIEEQVANALETVYERIHHHVMQSLFTKHFDETRWRNKGTSGYVWIASTQYATCLHVAGGRSREIFEQFVGPQGLGKAPIVSDRYAVYDHLSNPHQYCLAHLIRDFRLYSERDGPDGQLGCEIESELRKICKNHRLFRQGVISLRTRDARFRHQKLRLETILIDGFISGSEELAGLCERLLDCFSALWVFSSFADVDPTNNLAERDLRRVVLWRKRCYGTRSERGQRFVERISSVISTVKKAGRDTLNYLQDAVASYFMRKTAPLIDPILGF